MHRLLVGVMAPPIDAENPAPQRDGRHFQRRIPKSAAFHLDLRGKVHPRAKRPIETTKIVSPGVNKCERRHKGGEEVASDSYDRFASTPMIPAAGEAACRRVILAVEVRAATSLATVGEGGKDLEALMWRAGPARPPGYL